MPIVQDVIVANIAEPFRTETEGIRELFCCDSCKQPGFVELQGDVHCWECGNEITLCRKCTEKLIHDLERFLK